MATVANCFQWVALLYGPTSNIGYWENIQGPRQRGLAVCTQKEGVPRHDKRHGRNNRITWFRARRV